MNSGLRAPPARDACRPSGETQRSRPIEVIGREPVNRLRADANQRAITWVKVQENKSQGGRITAWRGQMHVMDGDPFYVIA